jgi:ubiquinone/menaquinone biosynthesis C-methylase UbiE
MARACNAPVSVLSILSREKIEGTSILRFYFCIMIPTSILRGLQPVRRPLTANSPHLMRYPIRLMCLNGQARLSTGGFKVDDVKDRISSHAEAIKDQFTKQSGPFTAAKSISGGLEDLVALANPDKSAKVLDVACGGGLVSCAFAPHVGAVLGVDITTAMRDQAKKLVEQKGFTNVDILFGDATRLPFPAELFDIVVSRYSVHHMLHPSVLIQEMKRVCRPGGVVVISDVVTIGSLEQAQSFNRLEMLRDPSHVANLPHHQLRELFTANGLVIEEEKHGSIRDCVESLLRRSFPATAADADTIRKLFRRSLTDNILGIPVAWNAAESDVSYQYPVLMLRGRKLA